MKFHQVPFTLFSPVYTSCTLVVISTSLRVYTIIFYFARQKVWQDYDNFIDWD